MNVPTRSVKTMRDYWRILVRRKWIVVVGALAAVVPAIALAMAEEPVYEANARMLVRSSANDGIFGTISLGAANPSRYVENEIQVLEGQVVAERLKLDLGLTTSPPGVHGTAVGNTDVINVAVRSGDPTTARLIADAYVDAYINTKRTQAIGALVAAGEELQAKITELQTRIDEVDQQIAQVSGEDAETLKSQRTVLIDQQAVFKQRLDQLQVDTALSNGNAERVQVAGQPSEPVGPKPIRTIALALIVGLVLGIGAAFLVDYLDDSIRSPEDLAELAATRPVLAVVPSNPPPDHRPIALSKPDDPTVEAYRTLRTNVLFLGIDGATRSIQITSSSPGDGKTTTATNLAVVLAQAGHKVVLIDADLRRPRVHEVFGIPLSPGLTTALVGEGQPLPVHVINDQLSVMAAGLIPPNPSEILSGRRMAQVMKSLTAHYDFVILDSAPVLPVSDAVALSRHVDSVLVVAQAGRTSRRELAETLASLEQVSAPVMGLLLNRARRDGSSYGYRYNDGYGYGYRARSSGGSSTGEVRRPPIEAEPVTPASR